ncbi:MAG: hypothetical protein B7X04_00210 [Parcubacteria group bacterium 21-54-25]|nr:MAG: hypothetical protein B7X04_00210 [Parcubacteria group bacterium 21-54-25]HQU07519.1 class I tRNA ligase family protein [Candidatus Paceibacterota bacterium]
MEDAPQSETAKREEEILAFWEEHHIFEKSLEKPSPKGEFTFYDGPPFATGTPHYGHIVASVMKDAVPRYKTMRGYHVPRVWGWDCHGLPIENIVEKELGFKHKKDIKAYGVEKFNERCRAQVLMYVDYWKKFIPRIGRFVDMEHAYHTMDHTFMESVWWVFKQVYDKGLVYEDYRSMHICPRCETTLSQQEVAEGYKDVKDIAVTVKFKVAPGQKIGNEFVADDKTFVLAWTTTPWTLPGNVALAVGKDVQYEAAKLPNGETYIFAFELAKKIEGIKEHMDSGREFSKNTWFFKGDDLVGLEYEPPFDYYKKDTELKDRKNGWKVYAADFVTTDTGTGIVHIAPAFGEDDMALGKEKELPFVQHVSYDGTMRPEVTDFAGREVKPRSDDDKVRLGTDIDIIKYLQEHGAFFSKENLVHSYPHCWRCDTPLLNYATTSWFVSVTKRKNQLLENAKKITWSPAHIKEGRFGKWLEGARDWSISRQRFWASAMPIWKDSAGNITVIGSVEELKCHTKTSGNTYLMMRHGESKGNVQRTFDSGNDPTNGLTEKGKTQVDTAAEQLKELGITKMYASPLPRTKETAERVANRLGITTDSIIYDERLREFNFGSLSDKSNPHADETFWEWKNAHGYLDHAPGGGESYFEVKNRFGSFLYELEYTLKNERILIVSHGGAFESAEVVLKGADVAAANNILNKIISSAKEAEVRKLDFIPLPHNRDYELDLHLPYIDQVQLVNEEGEPLTRVPDVLDTWFDSGSMPYAQKHYPFEDREQFEKTFPAQFIAEGVDQTRAWFYYLHVLGGALFDMPAFENVIVNGIVVSPEDGKKLSKSKKNYPDPMTVVEKYGADALRFYLLSSPVVAAENLAFSEEGVDDVAKKNLGRLSNVLSFYQLHADGTPAASTSTHLLDQWILARLSQLVAEVTEGYEHYALDRAARPIPAFIDDLSAWYVRRSRDRFKEDGAGKAAALATLRYVLRESAKVMAPALPFIAERIFQGVRSADDPESVHLASWPERSSSPLTRLVTQVTGDKDAALLTGMARVRALASEALMLRQKEGIKVRQPLAALAVPDALSAPLAAILADEVNVKRVETRAPALWLDTQRTDALVREGDIREFTRALAEARKTAGLSPQDTVHLVVEESARALLIDVSLSGVSILSFAATVAPPYTAPLSFGSVAFSFSRHAT